MTRCMEWMLVWAVSVAASTSFAGESSQVVQVEEGSKKYQVTIDSARKRVSVSVIQGGNEVPNHVLLTLTDAYGKKTALELKALQPVGAPVVYSGALKAANQSFVGLELRIPLRLEPALLLSAPLGTE